MAGKSGRAPDYHVVRVSFLADLFIHGIGGGKYDALTDELIRRFYGLEPLEYLILTGTLRLPVPVYPVTQDDRHRLQRLARDLHYNPRAPSFRRTRHVLSAVIREKCELIAMEPINSVQPANGFKGFTPCLTVFASPWGSRSRPSRKNCCTAAGCWPPTKCTSGATTPFACIPKNRCGRSAGSFCTHEGPPCTREGSPFTREGPPS